MNQFKRVVFLSASRVTWGAEESLLLLALGLEQQGVDVALCAYDGELLDRWRAKLRGEARTIPNVPSGRLSEVVEFWRHAMKFARRNDVFIIFTYYLLPGSFFYSPMIRLRRASVVLDMHDNLAGRKGRFLLNLFRLSVKRVVCVSEYTSRQFWRVRGLNGISRQVVHLHRPVERPTAESGTQDVQETSFRLQGATKYRVAVVGRLVDGKNHDLAIEAIARLTPEVPVQLVFRGASDGSMPLFSEQLVARAQERLGEHFVYEGRVPRELAYQGVDMLLVCNSLEPMGRTVIEAQVRGITVLVPDAGGSSELVVDGRTGYRYAADDPASLADSIVRVLNDLESAHIVSEFAQSVAVGEYAPEKYAERYLAKISGMSHSHQHSPW